MTSLVGKLISKASQHSTRKKRSEIWLNLWSYVTHIECVLIDKHDFVAVLFAEVICSLIKVSCLTSSKNDDERNIKIRYLKWTMEVFATVNTGGIYHV